MTGSWWWIYYIEGTICSNVCRFDVFNISTTFLIAYSIWFYNRSVIKRFDLITVLKIIMNDCWFAEIRFRLALLIELAKKPWIAATETKKFLNRFLTKGLIVHPMVLGPFPTRCHCLVLLSLKYNAVFRWSRLISARMFCVKIVMSAFAKYLLIIRK